MEKLIPLFKLDALLPRSIIACLCFDAIPNLAITKLFPPDVLAANLYYFLIPGQESSINDKLEVSWHYNCLCVIACHYVKSIQFFD